MKIRIDLVWAILGLIVLIGCAPVKPAEGPATPDRLPQTAEQCRAQPWLAWCHE